MPEASAPTASAEVAAAREGLQDIAAGLRTFQLHPTKGDGSQLLTGMDKFEHMTKMARRSVPSGTDLAPSAYLDVECSQVQKRLLNPTPVDYAMHEVMSHVHGEGAKQSMAKRKLDALGNIRGDCGLANDPERLQRLRNQLQLADSLAEISKATTEEKATKASQATAELIEKAPAATAKLKKAKGDASALTKDEMSAVAFVSFNGAVLKGDKAAFVKGLSVLMKAQPTIINLSPAATPRAIAEGPPNAAVEPPPAATEPLAVAEPPAADAPQMAEAEPMVPLAEQLAVQHRPKRSTAWQGPPPGEAL